jgi:hypothetical protein
VPCAPTKDSGEEESEITELADEELGNLEALVLLTTMISGKAFATIL